MTVSVKVGALLIAAIAGYAGLTAAAPSAEARGFRHGGGVHFSSFRHHGYRNYYTPRFVVLGSSRFGGFGFRGSRAFTNRR